MTNLIKACDPVDNKYMMGDHITECTIDLLVDISSGVFNTFRNTEDAPNFTSAELKLS